MNLQEPFQWLHFSFEEYAENARQAWKIPGMAVAIVANDQMVYAKGFGVKQIGTPAPVEPHTIFQIGSTSKAFTSALVAMQVDARKFQWDDRVVEHLPDFMMADPWVTRELQVQDLMAQHSGLAAYAGDHQAFFGFERQHIIHSLRYLQPVSSFRSKFAYVNNLFLVAAALIEKTTGTTWETNLEERLFKPLDMTGSTATLQGFRSATNLAIPHRREGDAIVPLDKDWQFHSWIYTYAPAGGINSNVIDMVQWLRLHLGRGTFEGKLLISADSMDFLHSPRTSIMERERAKLEAQNHPLWGKGAYYAKGWLYAYGDPYPIVWHNGATDGCQTLVALVPEAGVGIVVLSNLAGTEVPELLAQWFFDQYFEVSHKDWNQVVLDRVQTAKTETAANTAKPSEQASPPLELATYSGVYHNNVYGEIRITADRGTLMLTIGPHQLKTYLLHRDRDSFTWSLSLRATKEDVISSAYFDVIDGQAETLTVEIFSQEGAGVFQRVKP